MKKRTLFCTLGLTMLLTGLFCISSHKAENMTSTEQILTREIENGKTPSVQYYLFNEERILNSYQSGFAKISKKQVTDTNTSYHAYSVTKTFTALAILQLAEQGKLSLSEPIIRYLPDFPYGPEITVQQILNHTSGIANPIPLSWIHLADEHINFNRDAFFESVITHNNKIKLKPGEKFAYSNLGYVILGILIEKISGESYESYITENIIRKLPIDSDDLNFSIDDSTLHATGYHKRLSFTNLILGFFIDKSRFMDKAEGKWKPFKRFYVNGASYGGLIGRPTAFVIYIQELLKNNNSLISEKYKQMLFQENISLDGKGTGMCLSWFKGQLNGNTYYAHAGGGGGYYCEIRIYPELKIGSVIFFNRTGMTNERILNKLDKFYLEEINK